MYPQKKISDGSLLSGRILKESRPSIASSAPSISCEDELVTASYELLQLQCDTVTLLLKVSNKLSSEWVSLWGYVVSSTWPTVRSVILFLVVAATPDAALCSAVKQHRRLVSHLVYLPKVSPPPSLPLSLSLTLSLSLSLSLPPSLPPSLLLPPFLL